MQEPIDNLSRNAQIVHDDLVAHKGETRKVEAIVDSLNGELTQSEVENALIELERGTRAAQTFGGWSVIG